jgi:hypothetical protein
VGHLHANDFDVKTVDADDLQSYKRQYGVPRELEACHTAVVGGYVIEGHVPADLIRTLLREKPDIRGLSVPGMPIGSPGMEAPGRAAQHYDVLAIHQDGTTHVFARR